MRLLVPWLILSASAILCFFALWIVVPAPAVWLVAVSVGASELSPIFLFASIVTGGVAWRLGGTPQILSIALSIIAIALFAMPLLRYPSAAPLSMRRLLTGLEAGPVNITRSVAITGAAVPLVADIYRPVTAGPHPILVQVYGGAWQRGAPGNDSQFATYLASRGYVVYAIDYRHAPAAQWPAQIDDVRAALAWIRARAAADDADPSRMAIIGRSAGAQLAMVAGFDDPGIRAVISYYGPVNLARGWRETPKPDPIGSRPVLEAYLGGTPDQMADRYAAASPVEHVSGAVPRTLLIYGARDHIVQIKFGRELQARLTAAGAESQLVEIPWADHSFDAIPGGLSGQLSLWHTEQFLAAALQPTAAASAAYSRAPATHTR